MMDTRSLAATLTLTITASGALTAQAPAERGGFLMVIGSDTAVVERFTETGDTVSGSVAIAGGPRFEYTAALRADGGVASMMMMVFGPNAAPDAEPIQRAAITMANDSVRVQTNDRTRAFGYSEATLPLLNNSIALVERYTRRARAAGDSLEIPAFSLTSGVTLSVVVRPIDADSVTLTVAGQLHRLRLDSVGAILGGTVPSQRLTITRVGASEIASLALGQPDYSAPAGAPYTATEVSLTGPGGITLGGTLTVPIDATGPVPAVVTITGSGQQDRDEYIPVAGGYRPFRQVADTLGRRGIAVLRLDDRLVGASGGTIGTSADYADDIRAALAFLRTRPEIDDSRLALLGHSEGGLIAPMVAATDTALKGAVLLAGPSQNGAEILRYQQHQAIDNDTSIAIASRDSVYAAAAAQLDSLTESSPWLEFFQRHDPLATARGVTVPVLILHGGTDRQVTVEQAPALAEAFRSGGNPDVTMHIFPELNHLFIADPSGMPSGYGQLSTNRVAPEVLGMLADWLVERLGVTP